MSNANQTRERILAAAWVVVRKRGLNGATIGEIAASAGVSRQLVYFHFSNRAGLLVAMTRDHDARSGFRARALATRALEPVAAFEALVRAWITYVPEILPVALALEAAVVNGEDGAAAWRDRMGELHEAFRFAVARLADAGRLRPAWTVDGAADWAWARCQPWTWRHLVAERGWDESEFARRLTTSIAAEITG